MAEEIAKGARLFDLDFHDFIIIHGQAIWLSFQAEGMMPPK